MMIFNNISRKNNRSCCLQNLVLLNPINFISKKYTWYRYFNESISTPLFLSFDENIRSRLPSSILQTHIQGGVVYGHLVANRSNKLPLLLDYFLLLLFKIVGLPYPQKHKYDNKNDMMISESFITIVRMEDRQWSRWFNNNGNKSDGRRINRMSNFHSFFSFSTTKQ